MFSTVSVANPAAETTPFPGKRDLANTLRQFFRFPANFTAPVRQTTAFSLWLRCSGCGSRFRIAWIARLTAPGRPGVHTAFGEARCHEIPSCFTAVLVCEHSSAGCCLPALHRRKTVAAQQSLLRRLFSVAAELADSTRRVKLRETYPTALTVTGAGISSATPTSRRRRGNGTSA